MSTVGSFWTWQGWNALVAIGTLALACGTGALAWFTWHAVTESRDQIKLQTREVDAVEKQTAALTAQTQAVQLQASATEHQVRISAASLEAAARPVIVGYVPERTHASGVRPSPVWERVPYHGHATAVRHGEVHYEEEAETVYVSVPIVNVGAGVAFVQTITLLAATIDGRISNPVVEPAQVERVRFTATLRQADGRATDANQITRSGRGFAQIAFRIVYTAASRDLITTSEITVSELPDGGFLFTGTRIWNGADDQGDVLVSTENIG